MLNKNKTPFIKLHRWYQNVNQTSGVLLVLGSQNEPIFSCITLERGWRNNQKNISCVPTGLYSLELEYSPRFGYRLWELKGVPNRSECKFHSANYWYQLNGCISLGSKFVDINNDNYLDAFQSQETMKMFHSVLNGFNKAFLLITSEPRIINN